MSKVLFSTVKGGVRPRTDIRQYSNFYFPRAVPLMQTRWASIYKFAHHLVVCPVLSTTAGIRVAVKPFQVLPSSVSPIDLGEAVQCALEESGKNVPQPTDWKAFALPRLAAGGGKTEAAFQRKSQLVLAEFNGTVLKITPYRNGGAVGEKKGFEAAVEHEAVVNKTSPEAVGIAAFLAFEFCV